MPHENLTRVSSEVVINKPRSEVWKTLYENYGDVALFHPGIESSTCIAGGTKGGYGVQRVCNLDPDGRKYIKESIIEVVDGERFVIKMDERKGVPFAEAYAEYRLTDLGNRQTRVIQAVSFRTRPAFLGKLMKGKIGKDLAAVIVGLKYYLETGGEVSKTNAKAVLRAYTALGGRGAFAGRVS